jgi:hypothetical protein
MEAGAPSTEEVAGVLSNVCPPPPGVLMLAPPEIGRNASRAKSERPRQMRWDVHSRGFGWGASRGLVRDFLRLSLGILLILWMCGTHDFLAFGDRIYGIHVLSRSIPLYWYYMTTEATICCGLLALLH